MIIKKDKTVLFSLRRNLVIGAIFFLFIIPDVISQNPINFSGKDGNSSESDSPSVKERLFYGGSFSLQLGTVTNIEISPVIGFWILPRVALAAGPSYRYYKFYSSRTSIYGGRTYVQYVVFRDLDKLIPLGIHTSLFLHAEDEMLSLDSEYWRNVTLSPKRFTVNTFLAGAGLSQQISKRGSINFIVLWALNQSDDQVYNNPEIRISFIF